MSEAVAHHQRSAYNILDSRRKSQVKSEASSGLATQTDSSQCLHPTLVRVFDVASTNGRNTLGVVVPGWNLEEVIPLSPDVIPEGLRALAKPGFRFFAEVNLAAKSAADLIFKNFEIAAEPDPEDGLA